jgi:hypothetical protein
MLLTYSVSGSGDLRSLIRFVASLSYWLNSINVISRRLPRAISSSLLFKPQSLLTSHLPFLRPQFSLLGTTTAYKRTTIALRETPKHSKSFFSPLLPILPRTFELILNLPNLLSILVYYNFMSSYNQVVTEFGPKRYAPRPVSPTLGLSIVDGASDLVRRFFSREHYLAHLYKPGQHVIKRFDAQKNKDAYRLNPVFISLAHLGLLRVARTAVALVNQDFPFVNLGERFTFDEEINQERAVSAGGFPRQVPPLNEESSNPLDRDFDTRSELLDCARETQLLTQKFLTFIDRTYNKKGQSNSWDFDSVLAPVIEDSVNACYPQSAIYCAASPWEMLQKAANTVQDREDQDSVQSDRPAYSPVYQQTPASPEPISAPAPTPVASVPGFEVISDLDRTTNYIKQFKDKDIRLVSIANQSVTIDPRLTERNPAISVSSHFTRAESRAPFEDDPFHPDCACGTHHFLKLAYARGREDEHGNILRQNHDHGFIAHRIEDFLEFASATVHHVELKSMVEERSPSPPPLIGSPIDSEMSSV